MSNGIESLMRQQAPTAARPLLGLTLLLVEDSRFASEAVRLMCLRSGARIRRADCLRSARRHLSSYRPAVTILDLGLPDGSGEELIAELAQSRDRVEVILATSGDAVALEAARAAGADGCLLKPLLSLGAFQEEILRHLPPEARPSGPRAVSSEAPAPDPIALRDDLTHAAEIMASEADADRLSYVAQFVEALARGARDHLLADAARALRSEDIATNAAACARLRAMVMDRIARSAAV